MMYAVALLPLIRSLEDSHRWIQNWYADDSSCIGELSSVRRWFNQILSEGPAFGYFPEPSKTVLVVQVSILQRGRDWSLMPVHCDGCGEDYSLTHALDCRKGGLVTQRHNEIRDALGDLAALGYREVVQEPLVSDGDDSSPALIADLGFGPHRLKLYLM